MKINNITKHRSCASPSTPLRLSRKRNVRRFATTAISGNAAIGFNALVSNTTGVLRTPPWVSGR